MEEGDVRKFVKKGISKEEKEAQDARVAAYADQYVAEFQEKPMPLLRRSGGLAGR
jgi:hypothetical protein